MATYIPEKITPFINKYREGIVPSLINYEPNTKTLLVMNDSLHNYICNSGIYSFAHGKFAIDYCEFNFKFGKLHCDEGPAIHYFETNEKYYALEGEYYTFENFLIKQKNTIYWAKLASQLLGQLID